MDKPLVSVVIPVFNTGDSAKRIVREVLSESDIEVILVDDGSTDNSAEILRQIKDRRVKVYSKENGGPSAARNYGIAKANGKYLMFLDSDDEVEKDFITKMIRAVEDRRVALAVSGVRYRKIKRGIEENVYLDDFSYRKGENNKDFVLRSLLYDGRMYPVFNKIFDVDVVRKNNLVFDETMKFGEDTKFVLDYLKYKKGKIKFILEPLYIYNAGTSTSTAKKMETAWENWKKCFENLKRWVGSAPTLNERRLLAIIYLKWRASWLKAKVF